MTRRRTRRSDRLLRAIEAADQVVVIAHDNPDPDAIASGWALQTLFAKRLEKPVRLVGGGAIVRAENVRMLELLRPPLELVNTFAPGEDMATVLVDCSPENANHLLGDGKARPTAVIDHHQPAERVHRVAYRDIRPRAVASATIVAGYLREQNLEPERPLATAMLYAIRTETIGSYKRFNRTERGLAAWIAERADHEALQDIENAPLSPLYFRDLNLAIGNTFLHEHTAVCFLPAAASAETVGEVADLLIRCQHIRYVLCGAVVDDALVISARSGRTAGDVVRRPGATLRGVGYWGGHENRAGGKVLASEHNGAIAESLLDEIRERWLKACGVEGSQGNRLVPRREMLEIL